MWRISLSRKILLLSTKMKNYEIAAAVGIEDPNYFSVCFRRKYHKTPKEYRMKAGHTLVGGTRARDRDL
ncbi:helix-turn-helix domain-containing protein [Extibacter muris]|nr:helix-turn-helix domain-containing protein [Extibacter muris]